MIPPIRDVILPIITFLPASELKSVLAALTISNSLFHLSHICALASGLIIGKPLTLTAMIPPSFTLTAAEGIPFSTLITSIAIEGYTSSPIAMNSGNLLTTPSISGTVFNTPTPAAFNPNKGIGPSIPFQVYNQGSGSPIFAIPLGTGFFDSSNCVEPT